MAGRFPFDAPPSGAGNPNRQQQPQFTSAQMRAALGLPPLQEEASPYLQALRQQQQQQQQQQAQHDQQHQRDLQLRQMLLQEQIDQHLVEQRLRSALAEHQQQQQHVAAGGGGGGESLEQQYRNLLLQQQLQQQQQQQAAAAAQQRQREVAEQEYLRQRAAAQAAQQAANLRIQQQQQDDLRRQQAQQQQQLGLAARSSAAAAATAAAAHHSPLHQSATAAHFSPRGGPAAPPHPPEDPAASAAREAARRREEETKAAARAAALAPTPAKNKKNNAAGKGKKRGYSEDNPPAKRSKAAIAVYVEHPVSRGRGRPRKVQPPSEAAAAKAPPKSRTAGHHQPPISPSKSAAASRAAAAATAAQRALASATSAKRSQVGGALDAIAVAAHMSSPTPDMYEPIPKKIIRKGTVEQLISAADDEDKVDGAADTLTRLKSTEWSDSEDEDEFGLGAGMPREPAESIITPSFKSELPALPEEPLLEVSASDGEGEEKISGDEMSTEDEELEEKALAAEAKKKAEASKKQEAKKKSKKSSNVATVDHPYPIDTWWPSMTGIRRERRQSGETSDEDNFEEEGAGAEAEAEVEVEAEEAAGATAPKSLFRANEKKIRTRLSTNVEPGVLEKLNHCRIHRVRSKKKKGGSASDFVYCFQVTELYPNDVMVNCSVCGTWRHAACGGHYEQYSTRENAQKPFVAVCENCHEEEKFVKDHPKGEKRLDRQRMEQLRRGLATSAVMRNASYSKHSGTYKWPLGSVSATHIGGHTRSVHARHDKAERQWTDMASRLGRGYGYRPKDRVRIRTKELERLLVSIEDSESYTDRHNMLLFLLRDTGRDVPIGYQDQPQNIFDPAEDDIHASPAGDVPPAAAAAGILPDAPSATERYDESVGNSHHGSDEDVAELGMCMRKGCVHRRRFDSLFCSDACGVLALEMDLLRSLQDASDVHPSVLRLT